MWTSTRCSLLHAARAAEQLPALEHGSQLPGGEDGAEVPASEYEAARLLLRYLKDRVRDLDRDLPPADQTEVGLGMTPDTLERMQCL